MRGASDETDIGDLHLDHLAVGRNQHQGIVIEHTVCANELAVPLRRPDGNNAAATAALEAVFVK